MNIQPLDWQTIVALLIVMAAIAVLAKQTWNVMFKTATSGCGTGCSSCPSAHTDRSVKVTQLVQLDGGPKTPTSDLD